MADFGYDVSDYCAIDPLFGSLADFDALLEAAHARGLKVILDFVPNHTSDQHPWFRESRSSKFNSKRNWYVWRDAKPDGSPPNNWESEFGGPAWTFDGVSGQHYYHAYLKDQPDLNWRNPDVEQAMCEVLRFWFDRGVDGFRVDAIHHLHEDEEDRDNPPNPSWRPGMAPNTRWLQIRTIDQPGVHASIKAMRRVADAYPDRLMIGEAYLPIDRLMAYYGADLTGLHLPFNFHLISIDWKPKPLATLIEAYEAALPVGAWPNRVLGNHDRSRVASRVGRAQARVAAMLLLTLRGTPTIYQGEEIGIMDTPIPPHLVQDPFEQNVPGFGLGRDPVRTPMPWSSEPNGGFTEGRPWLPLNADADVLNVSTQANDPRSMLSLYRALIRLRRDSDVLLVGDMRLLAATEHVLAYERRLRPLRDGRAEHDWARAVLAGREPRSRSPAFDLSRRSWPLEGGGDPPARRRRSHPPCAGGRRLTAPAYRPLHSSDTNQAKPRRKHCAAGALGPSLGDPLNRLNRRRTSTLSTSCARFCGISTTARRRLGTTGRASNGGYGRRRRRARRAALNLLGTALRALGARESGTEKLEEAVAAYRAVRTGAGPARLGDDAEQSRQCAFDARGARERDGEAPPESICHSSPSARTFAPCGICRGSRLGAETKTSTRATPSSSATCWCDEGRSLCVTSNDHL